MPDISLLQNKNRKFATGLLNSISDVEGVSVGHFTLNDGKIQTGVTALLPHVGNIFTDKVPAACHVINGFGKSTGLIQIQELGNIETPIILTNTLSVGTAFDSLVRYMLNENDQIGTTTGTVNPVICECNDGFLNDIRGQHISSCHIEEALKNTKSNLGRGFERGAVGAGRGMSCYEMKGGIGTSSCIVQSLSDNYTLGALVLTNFGKLEDFSIYGKANGELFKKLQSATSPDKGSVIVILATDAPLSDRQLKRLATRAVSGLARTGAYIASGSGEIVISFSTRNKIPHYPLTEILEHQYLHEDHLDLFFSAATEAVEEAVIDSLVSAERVTGRDGHTRFSLKEFISGKLESRIEEK